MARITPDRTYKRHSEETLREALQILLTRTYVLTVPPDDGDADIVLSDAIDELLAMRKELEKQS